MCSSDLGVHDRAPPFAHHPVVPVPRLRADGLAYGPQDAERGPVVRRDPVVPLGLQGSDRRRCCIKLGHFMFGDDLPHAACVREGGDSFEDDLRERERVFFFGSEVVFRRRRKMKKNSISPSPLSTSSLPASPHAATARRSRKSGP